MQVFCTNCGQQIPGEDINVQTGLAKCAACNEVFSFAEQVQGETAGREPMDVPMPAGIRVEEYGPDLTITMRWFSAAIVFLVFFCVAWDGFLIFWYTMAFKENAPWIMVVFPIAHLAVGIGLTYFTVAGFINKTVIRVSGGSLAVEHGPLPWPGNRSVPTAELEQIYCTERHSHHDNSCSTTYHVHACLTNGRKLKLVSNLTDSDQAQYIEQKLEQHLGIPDRAVRGEMPH